jgi:hypothetical protein
MILGAVSAAADQRAVPVQTAAKPRMKGLKRDVRRIAISAWTIMRLDKKWGVNSCFSNLSV